MRAAGVLGGARGLLAGAVVALALVGAARTSAADDADYLAPHPDASWWLSADLDATFAAQPGFHSPYAGSNSFSPNDHAAATVIATGYAGYAIDDATAAVVSVESAAGNGLSDGLGLGGYVDTAQIHSPGLGATPYLGRAFVEHVFALSGARRAVPRDPLHLLHRPERRIAVRVGQLAATDSFDGADDPFLNWSTAHDAAYDHAANARGYTLGAIVEYATPQWSLRFGELMMPKVAHGSDLDFDLVHAHSENAELELHGCVCRRPVVVRVRAYVNQGAMGSYVSANADAAAAAAVDETLIPDVTASRLDGRVKYGVAVAADQQLATDLHVFARVGWSNGNSESFAYADADNTGVVGLALRGRRWHRREDRVGIAIASNGLSSAHSEYLGLGGVDALLGDGMLRYARETIGEAVYDARAFRGVHLALDIQAIDHPGYNADRGPVVVGLAQLRASL